VKNLKIFISILLILLCANSVFAKNNFGKKSNKVTIIKYQGETLQKPIPTWVEIIVANENDKVKLEKALKLDEERVFIVYSINQNLNYLKTWKDLLPIENEVNLQLEKIVMDVLKEKLNLQDDTAEAISEEKQAIIKQYSDALKNLNCSSAFRFGSFWVKTQAIKPNVKKAKSQDDYITEHKYFVILCLNKDEFEKQLEQNFYSINASDENSQMIKDAVIEKLNEHITINPSLANLGE